MALGHEKLDVYRLAIGYVAWVFEHSDELKPNTESVPISIAISISMKRIPNQTLHSTALRARE
ncbi:MAG TPA: hypothetical protein VMN36_13670 [Verrucomicrobiales bacterium]|nr:hypothetical protein [Verrucomicrobiales bacterium]